MRSVWGWLLPFMMLGFSDAHAAGRVLHLAMPAPSLGSHDRDVVVYLPQSYDATAREPDRRYPVIYLLHGFPGRSSDWFGRGKAAATADSLIRRGAIPEVILVCPDGNRGFFGRTLYANSYDGSFRGEDFMTHDLVAWTDSVFRTRADPAHRGIIGLSDGGTAAVNLVLRHPDLFGAAGAHSASFRLKRDFGMGAIVGPKSSAGPFLEALSPLDYLREPGFEIPRAGLYFDCGLEDPSFTDNLELDQLLQSRGVPHTFKAYPGSHTWSYWRAHFPESLLAVTRGM